jgi:hypothetical protein
MNGEGTEKTRTLKTAGCGTQFSRNEDMRGREEKIVVGRKEIARAGGITAALGEALSLAAMRMTPRAITAYEAVGSAPAEEDGCAMVVQIVVRDEEELREAVGAGAEAVLLEGVSAEEAQRLGEIARELRGDCLVEEEKI